MEETQQTVLRVGGDERWGFQREAVEAERPGRRLVDFAGRELGAPDVERAHRAQLRPLTLARLDQRSEGAGAGCRRRLARVHLFRRAAIGPQSPRAFSARAFRRGQYSRTRLQPRRRKAGHNGG